MVLGLPKAHHHNLSMKALTIAQMPTGLFVEFFVHAGIFGKFQMAKLSAKFIMKSCNSPWLIREIGINGGKTNRKLVVKYKPSFETGCHGNR